MCYADGEEVAEELAGVAATICRQTGVVVLRCGEKKRPAASAAKRPPSGKKGGGGGAGFGWEGGPTIVGGRGEEGGPFWCRSRVRRGIIFVVIVERRRRRQPEHGGLLRGTGTSLLAENVGRTDRPGEGDRDPGLWPIGPGTSRLEGGRIGIVVEDLILRRKEQRCEEKDAACGGL